jgi:hypothetical protein
VFVLTWTPPVCQVIFGEQSSIAVLHPACSRSCRSWPQWNSPTGPYLKDEVLASVQTPGLTRRGSTWLAMVHLCNRCVTSVSCSSVLALRSDWTSRTPGLISDQQYPGDARHFVGQRDRHRIGMGALQQPFYPGVTTRLPGHQASANVIDHVSRAFPPEEA